MGHFVPGSLSPIQSGLPHERLDLELVMDTGKRGAYDTRIHIDHATPCDDAIFTYLRNPGTRYTARSRYDICAHS